VAAFLLGRMVFVLWTLDFGNLCSEKMVFGLGSLYFDIVR